MEKGPYKTGPLYFLAAAKILKARRGLVQFSYQVLERLRG